LSVALLAVVLAVVPWLAEAASETLALDRRIGTGILSALAAVSLLALYRSLAPRVERVLFRERFALESGVTGLLDVIASLGDPRAILDFVGRRLSELFLPATCVVYEGLPSVDRLVPAFSSGTIARPGGLPTLSLHGSLALVLGRSTGPVSLEDATGERRALDVDQAESALVESLAPTVLLPIKAGEDRQGVISLGAKRSGDVYSSGELALLGAVADKVATRLEQIDLERRTATGPLVLPRKFELVERIGQGGMGIVFKVRHVALDTFVALKILPEHLAREPEFVRRFHREARLMAQLHHPSIVRVLDIDSEGSLHYFVMEYVAGHTLAELLREQGPLPLLRAVDVALQVAGALEHAHRHEPSVVHRDVTPSNILIEKETGRVVVTDFGIAKVAEAQAALTRTGDLFGKPRYAAPEQLRGDREIDARADIYSLGVVLHEMFAGHQIFAGLDDQTVLRRVAYEAGEIDFDFTRMTPEAFRTIVARAVAKDPERRYRSAADLIADLLRLRASLDDTATSPTETTTHAGASRASSLQEAGGLDATIAVAKRSRTSEP
jgi:serine/threonine protein kinase